MSISSRPTARQVAEGLGALIVLAGGVVGLPVALGMAVGWPLPRHIPTGGRLSFALRSAIPDSFWPHLFAALGWLAWAYFVACVITNLFALLRGRRRTHTHALSARGSVAALITAVMILGPRPQATSGRVAPMHAVAVVADLTAATSQGQVVRHTVVDGDTLWAIAETYYGDGERWQAIYQANVGVPQLGGGALDDAHWIYPGWSLVIPDVSVASPPTLVPAVPVTPVTLPPPPTPATAPVAPPATVAPAGPVSAGHQRTATPHGGVEAVPCHAARHDSVTASSRGTGDLGPLAIGAGALGLGAIGLVGALDRRRRRQSSQRAPHTRIPLPTPHSPLADLELRLRHFARTDSLFWLSRLGELLTIATTAGGPLPQVLGVRVGHDSLDVLVSAGSGEASGPFESRPGAAASWHLSYATDPCVLHEMAAVDPVPLTLAALSQEADSTVLVNLDHYGSVLVRVDAARVKATLAAIGTQLVGAAGSGDRKVVAVGFGHGVIDRLPGGLVVDDLAAFLAQARSEGERIIVLAAAAAVTPQLLGSATTSPGCQLLLVGPGGTDGIGFVFDPAHPVLTDHHLAPVEAVHVSGEVFADVEALLDLAEAPAVTEPDDEPYARFDVPLMPGEFSPAGPVVLGLLGDPTITVGDGQPQGLHEAVSPTAGTKARRVGELLVYLASHNGTATRGEWLTDVSPDKAFADGYVRNLVLLTRRSLEAITGEPELLTYEPTTQRLSLADGVGTDWAMFRSLTASGGPEGLRSALSLVRGAPFGSTPDPWTSAAGVYYVMVDDVTEAAAALGEHALSAGDPELATWAARQGLLANRYDQGLWRILLRAADEGAALQRVWKELRALLGVDGDATSDLDAETVDLYNSLITGTRDIADVVILQDDDEAVIPTRQAV